MWSNSAWKRPDRGRETNKTNPAEPVLSINLSVDYPQKRGVLREVELAVFPGEMLGLVGHSGAGKSTLALAILGLLDHTGATVSGRTILLGENLDTRDRRKMRDLRGRVVSLIPQSPLAALNPALRIGTQLREAWRAHSHEPWSSQTERIQALLASAGLGHEEDFLNRFPEQISAGQAQRVMIVMALLHRPALLIADEPTSALDLITQREVLDLLARINSDHRMSILFISHDLVAVASFCQRLAILHEGHIVECRPVGELLASPAHSYTKQLLEAVPKWRLDTAL